MQITGIQYFLESLIQIRIKYKYTAQDPRAVKLAKNIGQTKFYRHLVYPA